MDQIFTAGILHRWQSTLGINKQDNKNRSTNARLLSNRKAKTETQSCDYSQSKGEVTTDWVCIQQGFEKERAQNLNQFVCPTGFSNASGPGTPARQRTARAAGPGSQAGEQPARQTHPRDYTRIRGPPVNANVNSMFFKENIYFYVSLIQTLSLRLR